MSLGIQSVFVTLVAGLVAQAPVHAQRYPAKPVRIVVPYAAGGPLDEVARAIAVSSSKRAAILPDVPTIAETYPGYDLVTWMGIFVPAGTPRPIVTKLHDDFVKVLQRPDLRERFESQGTEVIAGSAEQLASLIKRETVLYAGIIKTAGIRPE